jgi:hypothetical protein
MRLCGPRHRHYDKQLKIDRAIYILDDRTRTYCFRKRNPEWKMLDPRENERNKTYLAGYKRIFRNGKTKIYRGPNEKRGS